MVTKEEKDLNNNTSENEDVVAESLPPPTVSGSKEKSVRSGLWVYITLLLFFLMGLYHVQHHIQVIPEAGALDMQEVMRKVVNTLDIMNNRIAQVEVENSTTKRLIGIKYYENSSINFLSSKCLLPENSEHMMWLNLKQGDICFLKAVKLLRGECEAIKAIKNEKENVRNVKGLANLGRVILDFAILQGDECDLLPQPQVEDVQGGGVYQDGQVEGQDEVDRN